MTRRPRRTVRLQLTLLYAVPFLLSTIVLLSVPILQFSSSEPAEPGRAVPRPVPSPSEEAVRHLVGTSAVVLAGMVVVSFVLGWFVAGRFLRPLRTITATAREISASNLHRRLGRTGRGDEFTELAGTLDDLFGRLEASFVSQRHFVANASHELRTPLTAERALLQVALADPDATVDSLKETCREVLALGAAQERLIESLLTLATSERGLAERERFDLAETADAVLVARAATARERNLSYVLALGPAPLMADPQLVESLVANLVDNALRHNRPGGRIEVTTSTASTASAASTASTVDGGAWIRVVNTGPVVPADQVARLVEPFQRLGEQRVRRATDGHGLGLAIVRAIADAHGARLTVWAQPEGGLTVQVTFPR